MIVTAEDVKKLRMKTGVSMMECKEALDEAGGDMENAEAILIAKGSAVAAKKSDRSLGAGVVASYIHNTGTVGSLIELMCETDFVARNDEFKSLANDIAMQVTATDQETLDQGVSALLMQPSIKDPAKTIGMLIDGAVQKFGERTELGRFVKFDL